MFFSASGNATLWLTCRLQDGRSGYSLIFGHSSGYKSRCMVKFHMPEKAAEIVAKYGTNGREAVNIVQIAAGIALTEGRNNITVKDVEWVVNSGQYVPRMEREIPLSP